MLKPMIFIKSTLITVLIATCAVVDILPKRKMLMLELLHLCTNAKSAGKWHEAHFIKILHQNNNQLKSGIDQL